MEVLTEEESRLVMESMSSPFTKHQLDEQDIVRLSTTSQEVLLIHRPGEDYKLSRDQRIPQQESDHEILIKVITIGLNPIDWKGPDYNFGLPSLPWINGRDLAGVVVKAHRNLRRIRVGDVVLSPSTDYRDIRKAAFQQYVISSEHTSARVPKDLPIHHSAAIGVAFVAAALALGICLGVNFRNVPDHFSGPDLYQLCRQVDVDAFASDIKDECLAGITETERTKANDWIAIWGASSATGFVALQLAKMAKLRVICIVDVAKHGERLMNAGADLLVDRLDVDRAIAIVRGVTHGRLRFAFDTVGKETAEHLARCLGTADGRSHLVGLTGLPKEQGENVLHHKVPIKAFHDISKVGEALMTWLERLLLSKRLVAPHVETTVGGLGAVNEALGRLRDGSAAGKRLVVPLESRTAVSVT